MPNFPWRPEDGLKLAKGLFLFIIIAILAQSILVRASTEHPTVVLIVLIVGVLVLLGFLVGRDDDGRGQGGTDRRTGERTPLWPTD